MMRWMLVVISAVVAAATPAMSAPFAWLCHADAATVSRIDLATNLTLTIPVGGGPSAVAATHDGLRAYVANASGSSVTAIDAPTGAVLATIPLPTGPSGIAVRTDGTKVYTANPDGTISVIDAGTLAVTGTIVVGGTLVTAVMNDAGTRLYATKMEANVRSVVVVDTATDALVADVFLSNEFSYTYGLAVSSDGTRIYAAALIGSGVEVVDGTSNLLLGSILLSGSFVTPSAVAVSPAGDRVYVTEFSTNQVAVLDARTMAEITTVPVGASPRSVDVTPDGTRAYIANEGDGTVSILDTATNTIVGTVLTLDPSPLSLGRFIVPGTSTTTTSTTSSTTTSTIPAPPALSAAALACQKTLALSFKRFGAKAHGVFVSCFQRVLGDVANGSGTSAAAAACIAGLDPGVATSKIARYRAAARAQILARCANLVPATLAFPCTAAATDIADTADCVLDAQLAGVARVLASEYGAACGVATAAGLSGTYPALCATP